MTPSKCLSIVIPARNEAAGLRQLLPGLVGLALDAEILVVDDGSTDDTANVCAEYRVTRLRNHYALGNGAAIKAGARAAKGDVLIFMDADGQHQAGGYSVAARKVCLRLRHGGRRAGSRVRMPGRIGRWQMTCSAVSRAGWWTQTVEDLTCGFRVVRADRFRKFLYLLPNGFWHPTTITMGFFRAGFSVGYVPIHTPRRIGKQPYSPAAGWRSLPTDHHQGRYAVFSAKAVFADKRQLLFHRPGVLPLYLPGLAVALPT